MTTGTLILFFTTLFLFSFAIAALSLAPWVPMRSRDLERINKLANFKSGETFYDLGCGDGKVVLYAGERNDITAIGIELALPMYLICKVRKTLSMRKNINFKLGNIFNKDFSDADVVYVFGMPKTIKNKLKDKLVKELKPGSRIISYTFSFPGLTPVVVDKPTPKDISIYVYEL
ncbi:MAG: class I SAM-dependent methyltransferase [bacterium]|nr:class I SAM-dependent methyltransferase [bacterium]